MSEKYLLKNERETTTSFLSFRAILRCVPVIPAVQMKCPFLGRLRMGGYPMLLLVAFPLLNPIEQVLEG